MLLGFAPHILQVDGPFLQPPNDRLYVRDLLLLVVGPRRYTAPALVEDFVDLAYRLDGILLGVFVVGGIGPVIRNCQEVSGTTWSVLWAVVDQRVEGIGQALDLLLDLVHSLDDFHQI